MPVLCTLTSILEDRRGRSFFLVPCDRQIHELFKTQSMCGPQEQDEQMTDAKGEAEMYEARAGRALLQVNAIRNAVTDLFGAANCKIAAAQEVLATGPVGPANLMQYLGIVEQRVDQTLRVCRLKS